jgi:hypothetical protein
MSRKVTLPKAVYLGIAITVVFALGATPAAASAHKNPPQGKVAIAQCQKAAMGHAKETARTESDCSWLPPASISIDHCPTDGSVDVIKVGSSSIAVPAGSVPMTLLNGSVTTLLNVVHTLCSNTAPALPSANTTTAKPKPKSKSVSGRAAAFLS